MTILVDADIVAYRSAAASEGDPEEIAILRTDSLMKEIIQHDDTYLSFLTGSQHAYPITEVVNFRKIINPEYKANRKDVKAPKHLDSCRKYLIEEYGSTVTEGYEADDALGFNQTEDTIIATIDKDLMMIPGHHYNFVKKEYKEVSELDGLRSFYRSMLVGDSSDNVFGVKGIGKIKAAKLIDPLTTEEEMYRVVFDLYTDSDTTANEYFWMNADCLWIWRKENEKYSGRKVI